MNLLKKIFSGLSKKDALKELEERELELLESNVSLKTIETLKKTLEEGEDLRTDLKRYLKGAKIEGAPIILLVGVNGSGKTTAVAKLAYWFKKRGIDVTVAAADTFRAGSIEQLEEWSKKVGFDLVKYHYGADPAAVAYEAVKKRKGAVIIDTAGRQETRGSLMEELKKIKRVVNPDLTIMVVDATQGSAALEQARKFDEAVGVDGFIVTKTDVDEKGGMVLSLAVETEKPIYFISYGQEPQEFKPFDPEEYLDNLL
jgi:fused signal recognition particle receptor